jgi:Helicase conserved C-terminal domain/SNF2-related domain
MWQGYIDRYGLRGKVVPISRAVQDLPNVPARFRLVLIDESHNLRNKDGKRYQAIKDYIEQSGSRCILLTATPYNKTYLDLSAQLQLFLRPDTDLGIKPEAYIRSLGGEMQFRRRHSTSPVRSLLAFEQSPEPQDWQQLMSRYMVRRTRSFIKNTYAKQDGERYYLEFADGSRSYFPTRRPRTVRFAIGDPQIDSYARLYADRVVDAINDLNLPRYSLGLYIAPLPSSTANAEEELSEGQNLQDCAVILNYDLPWAIIRLIQRAGRVDRIGQQAEEILCYSFLPAEGVERLINLRGRLRDRLNENQEVVGTDEAFFEDEQAREMLLNLYNERSGVLDEADEGDVDLTSEALQIWQSAIDANPSLKGTSDELCKALDLSSAYINVNHSQTGAIQMEQFKPREAKPIIDEIDRVLAQQYGFTDEELDFIIHYDIKYRMGCDSGGDDS